MLHTPANGKICIKVKPKTKIEKTEFRGESKTKIVENRNRKSDFRWDYNDVI